MTGGAALGALAFLSVWVIGIGAAFSVMWGWFLVPLGLPPIAVDHGIGIMAMLWAALGPLHGAGGRDNLLPYLLQPFIAAGVAAIARWSMG